MFSRLSFESTQDLIVSLANNISRAFPDLDEIDSLILYINRYGNYEARAQFSFLGQFVLEKDQASKMYQLTRHVFKQHREFFCSLLPSKAKNLFIVYGDVLLVDDIAVAAAINFTLGKCTEKAALGIVKGCADKMRLQQQCNVKLNLEELAANFYTKLIIGKNRTYDFLKKYLKDHSHEPAEMAQVLEKVMKRFERFSNLHQAHAGRLFSNLITKKAEFIKFCIIFFAEHPGMLVPDVINKKIPEIAANRARVRQVDGPSSPVKKDRSCCP